MRHTRLNVCNNVLSHIYMYPLVIIQDIVKFLFLPGILVCCDTTSPSPVIDPFLKHSWACSIRKTFIELGIIFVSSRIPGNMICYGTVAKMWQMQHCFLTRPKHDGNSSNLQWHVYNIFAMCKMHWNCWYQYTTFLPSNRNRISFVTPG